MSLSKKHKQFGAIFLCINSLIGECVCVCASLAEASSLRPVPGPCASSPASVKGKECVPYVTPCAQAFGQFGPLFHSPLYAH